MLKLRGYVSSGRIGGQIIPQRVQNLVIRSYCADAGYEYLLSATEYNYPGSFMVMSDVLSELGRIDGVAFYSIDQLPSSQMERYKIYKKFLNNKKELHFCVESWCIDTEVGVQLLEDILEIRRVSPSMHGADVYNDWL